MSNNARTILDRHISEKAFQDQIIRLAKLCGWMAYHTYNSRRSAPGFPDLVLAKPGNPQDGYYPIVFLECKAHNGRLSDDQKAWLQALDVDPALGDYVVTRVVRPSHWEWIEQLLTTGNPRTNAENERDDGILIS